MLIPLVTKGSYHPSGGRGAFLKKANVFFNIFLILSQYISAEVQAVQFEIIDKRFTVWNDWAYVLLVIILVLFAGLRTSYNDTGNYISGFNKAPMLLEFLLDSENLNPFKNPLFYVYQSALRTFGFDAQMMIFLSSLFTQVCILYVLLCG